MNAELVEKCAEALWNEYVKDPANRHHINRIFKKPYSITWRDANDPDVIPLFADRFRAKARVAIVEIRKWIAANSKNNEDMLELFISATSNVE